VRQDFKLYGIFGFPLGHTLSPVMQEAAFKALGIKAFYLPVEVRPAEFRRLMRGRKRLLLDGFNVTVPYKGTVLKYLDGLTPRAKAIGAVNTVFRKGRLWIGDNTDCQGFLISLRKEGRFSPRGKRILLLGAGGAARAVAYGLAQSGAKQIRIMNREKFRVRRQGIIRDFKKIFPKTSFAGFGLNRRNLMRGLENVHLVVNATSVGVLFEDRRIIPPNLIPQGRKDCHPRFFDLGYPRETLFLKDAKKKGHRILGGLGMLVYQGAEAFRLWTGHKAPVAVMRAAVNKETLHAC
jgi:shikimate dehydrogenase